MRTPLTDLDAQRTTTLAKARTLLDGVKAQGREPTALEQANLTALMDSVANLDTQIKGRALVNRVLGGVSDYSDNHSGGGVFSDDTKAAILHAVKSRTAYRGDLNVKAAITTGGLLPTSGIGVEGGLHPNSQFSLASLFPNQPADGPSVRYYRTTAGVAAVVAEAQAKPDAGVSFAAVDLLLTKLACIAQFSDEMAEDSPYLLKFLADELVAAVYAAENALIVSTFVATSGVLTATGAAATVVDMIAAAIGAQEAVSGITPSAIIANPVTIGTIRQSKASTSGVYNVDILSASPSMLHGVRLVSSPAVAAANVWLAGPGGVTIFRRGPVTFELGHNDTDWASNTQTARAEERLGVAVTRPSSLTKLVLT